MLGNSVLNKLWNIITGCIVSLILCSIVVSSTSQKQCGEGTGDVSLSVELVDRSSTAGRPRHCRSCCSLEKLLLVHRLPDGVLLSRPLSSAGEKSSREMGIVCSVLMAVPCCHWLR